MRPSDAARSIVLPSLAVLSVAALATPALATRATPALAAPAGATPAPADPCTRVGAPVTAGSVASADLDELSGMGASRTLDGVLWAHADSGDAARLFALGLDGSDLGTYDVVDATGAALDATDWEDLAVVRLPDGTGRIVVADIGDNGAGRSGGVVLHRIPEPTTAPAGTGGTLVAEASLVVHYPDGPTDAEALLVDPADGTAIVVTKDPLGSSRLLVVPAAAWVDGATAEVDAVDGGRLDLTIAELAAAGALGTTDLPGTLVTGGDLSPDGTLAVLRTYRAIVLVERPAGSDLATALSGPHCVVAGPDEPQGEAITITADGSAILTATEVERAVASGALPAGATSPLTELPLAAPALTEETATVAGGTEPAATEPAATRPGGTEASETTPDGTTEQAEGTEAVAAPTTTLEPAREGEDDRGAAYAVAAVGAVVAVAVMAFALRPRRGRRTPS